MYEEDDTVQLISSRSLPKSNGRAKRHRTGNQDMLVLSDSELGGRRGDEDDEDPAFEETTVFSDSLYGDSLPSMRAQMAVTQMQNRRRREVESPASESRALVGTHDKHESLKFEESSKKENELGGHGQYSSLGGKILHKRRGKKDFIMKL